MDTTTVSAYLAAHAADFPPSSYSAVRDCLKSMNEQQFAFATSLSLKSPIIAFVLSFFLGGLGIDRFYIGDIILGLLKLITLGGLGIWWLVDLFLIIPAARRKNLYSLFNIPI